MTWKQAKDKLRECRCGCREIALYRDGNPTCGSYAECTFCHKTSESSTEPCDVVNDWNLRGCECIECDSLCEEPGDELCPECWQRGIASAPVPAKFATAKVVAPCICGDGNNNLREQCRAALAKGEKK